MSNNSGAEFAINAYTREAAVLDFKELGTYVERTLKTNADRCVVSKYPNIVDKQNNLCMNIYDHERAESELQQSEHLRLPQFIVSDICTDNYLKSKIYLCTNRLDIASDFIHQIWLSEETELFIFKARVNNLPPNAFETWYKRYKKLNPGTKIWRKRNGNSNYIFGYEDVQWSSFAQLCLHLDIEYSALCDLIRDGLSLDQVCDFKLGIKTYGDYKWRSYLNFNLHFHKYDLLSWDISDWYKTLFSNTDLTDCIVKTANASEQEGSGAEFAVITDSSEAEVFDISKLREFLVERLNDDSNVCKVCKYPTVVENSICVNVFDLKKFKSNFPKPADFELPRYFISRNRDISKSSKDYVGATTQSIVYSIIDYMDTRKCSELYVHKATPYLVSNSLLFDLYEKYRMLNPETNINCEELNNGGHEYSYFGVSWRTLDLLCMHMDLRYGELCELIENGMTLDEVCDKYLCWKKYSDYSWRSWVTLQKEIFGSRRYVYGFSQHYKECLEYHLDMAKKPKIVFNYLDSRKIPDSITVTLSLTGIKFMDKDDRRKAVKEKIDYLDQQVVEALKSSKAFQKIGVPINCLKVVKKTLTQADELVYYINWKETAEEGTETKS